MPLLFRRITAVIRTPHTAWSQRKPNHIYFLIVTLALTFAVGVVAGCGNGQAETRRAAAREIQKTAEYLDRTKDYLPNLLKLTDTFLRVAELEGKATMDAEIELLKSEIDVIRLQRSRYQTTDAPLQAVTYRDLVLLSFDSMERSFMMLLATFQQVLQPNRG